jgi:hypothetical protein
MYNAAQEYLFGVVFEIPYITDFKRILYGSMLLLNS